MLHLKPEALTSGLRQMTAMAGGCLALAALALPAFSAPLQLHVNGNQLQDSNNANVRLQGVNIPSLEWSNGGENISQSQGVAHGTWNAKLIRLPLSQDRWFGHAGQTDGGAAYKAIVDGVVNTASSGGYYVLLDCHWSDEGVWGSNMAQHKMPDNNTSTFWNDCANRYKNNPAVLFDLYNEPNSVTWSVWRNGGSVTDSITYNSPGMQSLLNTVRATGANNVIVAGGLDWAYDLTGIVNGSALTETGSGKGIVYAAHVYPWKGADGSSWDPKVTVAASAHPILIGEVGADTSSISGWNSGNVTTWCNTVVSWMNSHNYNFTAWAFHPSAGPTLITDWNYTPSTAGTVIKAQLTGGGGGGGGNTHGGTWAGKAVLTTTAGFTNMFEVRTVPTSQTYVASIWLKGSGSLELAVKNGNWGSDITTLRCNATSTWTKYTTSSFSTGSNTQLTFVLQDQYGGTAGTVYIDDGFLGINNGTNQLTNPGFESGNTAWSLGSAFSIGQF